MTIDTSERGLERLIIATMARVALGASGGVADTPATYGSWCWIEGNPNNYNREYAVDLVQRNGLKHRQYNPDFFYGAPSPMNKASSERLALKRVILTRQLRYSRDETQLALDLVTFINGLTVFTFELKNNLSKQTVADAVQQYQRDRNPRELLFQLGRCVAHFAVHDQTEQGPLLEDDGIEAFIHREVLPYAPDVSFVASSVKIGYQISFTRYFYKPQPLRSLDEIGVDILELEHEIGGLLAEIVG